MTTPGRDVAVGAAVDEGETEVVTEGDAEAPEPRGGAAHGWPKLGWQPDPQYEVAVPHHPYCEQQPMLAGQTVPPLAGPHVPEVE